MSLGLTKLNDCLLLSEFQVSSVTVSDLDAFHIIIQENVALLIQYHSFFESAKQEASNLERNLNSQLLSRTGFVFQEIKDSEFSVSNEISERSVSTNNTECIDEANDLLRNASDSAGASSMGAYEEIIQRITFSRFILIYPTLTELARRVSAYDVEPLSLLGFFNPLTNFNGSLDALIREVEEFESLFEQFVDQVIAEMIILDRYGAELHQVLIASLEAARGEFASSVQDVRNVLAARC